MRLPNAEQAYVDIRKLRDYCLNPNHPRGRHKARVFQAALGLRQDDAHVLRGRLLEVVHTTDAVLREYDEYGALYELDFEMQGPEGTAQVRSIWIVRRDESYPRLITCYVL